MIKDDWTPSENDIEWTRGQLERMQVGDTWGVADSVLRKDIDNVLTVVQASPASIMPLERIKKVCAEIGYKLFTDGAEIIHDPQAAAQQAAQEWEHEGIPVVNYDLENAEWMCIDPDTEAWRVLVRHESDNPDKPHEVALSPMDYNILAGDELFFTWDGMRVLERHEIILMADDDTLLSGLQNNEVFVMPTVWKGTLVPPHLRGLIFVTDFERFLATTTGEEE